MTFNSQLISHLFSEHNCIQNENQCVVVEVSCSFASAWITVT